MHFKLIKNSFPQLSDCSLGFIIISKFFCHLIAKIYQKTKNVLSPFRNEKDGQLKISHHRNNKKARIQLSATSKIVSTLAEFNTRTSKMECLKRIINPNPLDHQEPPSVKVSGRAGLITLEQTP